MFVTNKPDASKIYSHIIVVGFFLEVPISHSTCAKCKYFGKTKFLSMLFLSFNQ